MIKSEAHLIAHFKTLDHEEKLLILENDLPDRNHQMFTDDDMIEYHAAVASNNFTAISELEALAESRREKLVAIYRKTLN